MNKIAEFISRLFCQHLTVKCRPKADHAMNYNNLIRLECSHCAKVFYKYGRELHLYNEKQCYYDKKVK